MGNIFATADIGSNTVHLLVAEVLPNGRQRRLVNESEWLSLGESVARTGSIASDRLDALIELLRNYEMIARQRESEPIFVFATEAMRAAKNSADVIRRIAKEANVEVQIIRPHVEAEFSLLGAKLDAPAPIGVLIEIGGGSAQVALCHPDGSVAEEFSLPIGTGRLIASADLQQPPTPRMIEHLSRTIQIETERLPSATIQRGLAVASGGVGRGLWRALHPDGDKFLYKDEIEHLMRSCSRLSIEQIVARFSVKPKRAAALFPGSFAYLELMNRLGIERLFVSEYGVREGAIQFLVEGRQPAWLA